MSKTPRGGGEMTRVRSLAVSYGFVNCLSCSVDMAMPFTDAISKAQARRRLETRERDVLMGSIGGLEL